MGSSRPTVIFADADALPGETLEALTEEDVDVVLCSSQTRAELEMRQQDLRIGHPFICENGSAAFIRRDYFGFDVPNTRRSGAYDVVEFGKSYEYVARTLQRVSARLRIPVVAFNDMSVDEVARDCGLPLLQARLSKLREYQEVFRVRDPRSSGRNVLRRALQRERLRCTEHGRYDHVGHPVSLSAGVDLLCQLYRRASGAAFTVGIGSELTAPALRPLVDQFLLTPLSKNTAAAG